MSFRKECGRGKGKERGLVEHPVVSVAIITYRQERYIRQAVDSVLRQRFPGPWEVLVGEDASPDRTREILMEYRQRDPRHIRLFLREENMGATRNLYEVLRACAGRYVALLEGDDYWTDPDKIWKQVEYLEHHPKAIACTHRCLFVDERSRPIPGIPVNAWFYSGIRYTFDEFCSREMPGQVGTLVMRNIFQNPRYDNRILYQAHPIVGDRTLFMLLAAQGEIHCLPEVMGCYRMVQQPGASNWISQSVRRNVLDGNVRYLCALEEYCRSELRRPVSFERVKREYYGQAFCKMLRRPSRRNIAVVWNILRMSARPFSLFGSGITHLMCSLPRLIDRQK